MIGAGYLVKIVALYIYLGAIGYGILVSVTTPIAQYPAGDWDTIIDGQEFTQTLALDTGDDNTLIVNSTFHDIDGNGIMIRNVKNVYIKDCLIYDVADDGVVLSSTGSSQNVTIDGCTIHHTGRSGIIAKQRVDENVNHLNLVIKNNTIYNTGQSEYDHGIYVQTTDSLLEHNVIYNSTGHGISLRSSGIVRGNKIWETQESCIRYYSDNVPGSSNSLYIENNICYQLEAGAGDPGISLLRADTTPEAWLVQDYYIRFNTVVVFTAQRDGFAVESAEFGARNVQLYGNLFINTHDISKTLQPGYVDYLSSNYTSTSLEGFVNPSQVPYDFELTAASPARYYASTEADFPATDINGAVRVAGYLDAGAHQFSVEPLEENAGQPVIAGQVKPLVENSATHSLATPPPATPDPPVESSANPITQNQAKPSPPQSNQLLCFTSLIGLLGLVAVAKSIQPRIER